jgi:hypothetical protein
MHTLSANASTTATAPANTAACAQVPMVFWGEKFWKDSCIYDALEKNSRDRPMHEWVSYTSLPIVYIVYTTCINI